MRYDCQESSNYLCVRIVCVNVIDKEDRNWKIFYFMNNRMQTDLRLKTIQKYVIKVENSDKLLLCFRIDLFEKWLICDFRSLKFSTQTSIL